MRLHGGEEANLQAGVLVNELEKLHHAWPEEKAVCRLELLFIVFFTFLLVQPCEVKCVSVSVVVMPAPKQSVKVQK